MSDELRKNRGGEEYPIDDQNKDNIFFSMDEAEEVPDAPDDHALTDEMEALLDEMISQNAQEEAETSGLDSETHIVSESIPADMTEEPISDEDHPDDFSLQDLDEEDDHYYEEENLPEEKPERKSHKVKENKTKKKKLLMTEKF